MNFKMAGRDQVFHFSNNETSGTENSLEKGKESVSISVMKYKLPLSADQTVGPGALK